MKKLIVAIALLIPLASIHAQKDSCLNKLSVGLEFLAHGEDCRGGLPKPEKEDDVVGDYSSFLLERTRLKLNYERPGLEAKLVLRNTAVWGMSGNQALNLHETWVKLKAPSGLFTQIGRMALSYDDERIIGPDDWVMEALPHDALLLGYEGHGHKVHGILAYNQNAENVYSNTFYKDGAQDYKTMQTVWYHYDFPKFPFGASLLFMNIGMQAGSIDEDPHIEYQQLFGGYVNYHPKYLTLEGSYYRQAGHNEYNMKIDAWMASAKATIKPSDIYNIKLGYDYLSGDDYVAVVEPGSMGLPFHEVMKGFCPIYGSHHQFYGVMDYFYKSAYLQGFTPGLQNAWVGFHYTPTKKLTCDVSYHYMAVATDLRGLDRTLGHDIELEANYDFTNDISLSVGYTYMRGTNTMDRLKQGNDNKNVRWAWVSLQISPNLFTTKW